MPGLRSCGRNTWRPRSSGNSDWGVWGAQTPRPAATAHPNCAAAGPGLVCLLHPSELSPFNSFKKLINFKNLFYFWLRWVFVVARGLSLVAASRATLPCGTWASHCSGFSRCRARALGTWDSVVGLSSCGSQALERRLSSCGARASLLRGTWDLPGPGIKPVSPALAGGFLTTAPPGKPLESF